MATHPVPTKAKGFLAQFRAWPAGERLGHALRSWKTLNHVLMELTEAEVERGLKAEEANKRRGNVLKRLRQRLAKIRRDTLVNRTL